MLSLGILVISMLVFPEKLGTGLAKVSLLLVLGELGLYAAALFVMYPRAGLFNIVQGAGLCLAFRLVLGAAFGLMVALGHSLNMLNALKLGMSSYVPGIVLQVVATPLILRPVLGCFWRQRSQAGPGGTHMASKPVQPGTADETSPKGTPSHRVARPADRPLDVGAADTALGANGFDRTTRYLGEHGAVQLAAVVDHEGLLISRFVRGSIDAEEWAPYAQLLWEANGGMLGRIDGEGAPTKIDILTENRRIVVAWSEPVHLLVVAERDSDELLHIRISQSLESIRKTTRERYSQELVAKPEKAYV